MARGELAATKASLPLLTSLGMPMTTPTSSLSGHTPALHVAGHPPQTRGLLGSASTRLSRSPNCHLQRLSLAIRGVSVSLLVLPSMWPTNNTADDWSCCAGHFWSRVSARHQDGQHLPAFYSVDAVLHAVCSPQGCAQTCPTQPGRRLCPRELAAAAADKRRAPGPRDATCQIIPPNSTTSHQVRLC